MAGETKSNGISAGRNLRRNDIFFAYNDGKIGQGRENAKLYLQENPEIMAEVENKVREKFGLTVAGTANGAED